MYKFSERSKKNLEGIHPDLVRVMNEAIRTSPIDFTITDGVRTVEEQQARYAQGRVTKGRIVTQCDGVRKKSNHQLKADGYGHAVDLYPYYNGTVHVNDAEKLTEIAAHIKSVAKSMGVKIAWGGDWTMRDYPHFELA